MTKMTLGLAEECIEKVKQKATEMGVVMSIAVVDEAGKLVGFARMRGNAGFFGEKLPIAKAKTAVAYRRTTKDSMEEFTTYPGNNYVVSMSGMYPGEFCVTPGGAPVFMGDELIGAIGVSGSTPEDDHECVMEALKQLKPGLTGS